MPSLRYLDQVPEFGIGPESELEDESGLASNGPILQARSGVPGGGVAVPHGGLFWDGRASTLQDQAHGPLFNPVEMANRDTASVVARLRSSRYGAALARLFGAATVSTPGRLLDEAMFAIARFQIEDSTFHPYTSKYDAWLEGKAVLSPAELAGLRAFEDSTRGNCAACHLSRPGPDRRPPTFTDFEYVALAPPRNDAIPANADPNHFDLGLCGPVRTDLRSVPEYCGLFRTPSLRNVARRSVFFHNGVYRSLEEVMRFYNLRAPFPDSIYPRDARGRLRLYDDLPVRYAGNVDTTDTPFDRPLGGRPALTQQEIADIIAFLRTLTDGYRPEGMRAGR